MVSFDQFAQRWIISVLALLSTSTGASAPFYHCIAYSTTADASGSWYESSSTTRVRMFPGGTNYLPDYPKQGVWRDAYTYTYDMFNSAGTTYQGSAICGMDRNAILGGS